MPLHCPQVFAPLMNFPTRRPITQSTHSCRRLLHLGLVVVDVLEMCVCVVKCVEHIRSNFKKMQGGKVGISHNYSGATTSPLLYDSHSFISIYHHQIMMQFHASRLI